MSMHVARVLYNSTIRGVTQRELNSEDIVYIGIFIRIPKRNIRLIAEIELGIDHEKLMENISVDGFTYEYVHDGILERVEIRERDTGDLLAFWRVPFRKKVEGNPE